MNLDAISSFFSYVPTDWIIIVVLAILLAFDALRAGFGRVTALALSLPAALFLISALPQAKILSGIAEQFSTPLLGAVLFGIVFAAMYLLVRRMCTSYSGGGRVIQALMAGIAGAAVLIVVWIQVPELQSIWHFGAQVQAVFGEAYRFWWIVFSYSVLAFVRS